MKVLVAAEDSGSLKEVIFPRGTDTSKQDSPQPLSTQTFAEQGRKNCIDKLAVFTTEGRTLVAAARRNCTVELYDPADKYEIIHSWTDAKVAEDEATIVGLEYTKGLLVACTSNGRILTFDVSSHKFESASLDVGADIATFRLSSAQPNVFAIGGKDLDVELWSMDVSNGLTLSNVWKSKNLKNDRLDLKVPIWVTNVQFLPSKPDTYQLLTITRYGQVRIYDTAKGRRPYRDFKVSKHPLKPLVPGASGDFVVFSDNHRTTYQFQLSKGIDAGHYGDATGAVQSLYSYNGKLLAAGGLDRYLRVFDMSTRETLGKVFIGTQISAVWILSGEDEEDTGKREAEAEEDDMWNELEKVAKKTKKAKTA